MTMDKEKSFEQQIIKIYNKNDQLLKTIQTQSMQYHIAQKIILDKIIQDKKQEIAQVKIIYEGKEAVLSKNEILKKYNK